MALSAAYSQMFADMFKLDYQAKGRLRMTVNHVTDIVGSSWKDKVFDEIALQSIGLGGDDIPASSIVATAPSMSPSDYAAKLRISDQEAARINADAVSKYVDTLSRAVERREDQFVIDAFVAGVTNSVAVGTTNLTTVKFKAALKTLGVYEINSEDNELYCVMHANNYDGLLRDNLFTSADYVKETSDIRGYKGTYLGVKLIVLGDRTLEGGLPKAGNNRSCFMYDRNSTTLGYWVSPKLVTEYQSTNFRTEVAAALTAGAVTSLSNGVVEIVCDETA